MKSDTTAKNTTPLESDPVLVALVLLAIALEALLLALRPLLTHAIALVLTTAGWRPIRPPQKESAKPAPQRIKTNPAPAPKRPRRTRHHAPVAA